MRTAGLGSKAAATGAGEFLRGLRQLRKHAGLGHAELAARAHYPREVIKAAESGPSLPDLPLLAAFVRGCGGSGTDVAEWEDWWRTAAGAPAVPLLPVRAPRPYHSTRPTRPDRLADAVVAGRATVPSMRPPTEGPLARDIPRSPSAPTVAESRRAAEPRPTAPEHGGPGAMSDFALAIVVIAASAVCALAIAVTIFA